MSNVTDLTLFGDAITSTATGIKLDGANALALSAYNKTIGVVAVDAFIYDTSKDSDGGAWRKRTQHTSWYNETLNTATRGSRREFPAVAVIVAESNKVTIYDGDEPDCPMWMVFNGLSIGYMIYGLIDGATSVVMQNAQLVVSTSDVGSGGVNIVDFIKETGSYINESPAGPYKHRGNIKQRNDALNVDVDQSFYGSIVDRLVNDVAMTVLPSAPIDSATGLPVPTIAVATDGGVSVIKDDGTVVDITVNNVAYTFARKVDFLSDNSLGMGIGVSNGVAQESYYIFNSIPSSDNVITVDNITGTTKNVDEFYAIQSPNALVDLQLLGLNSNRALLSSTGNSFASNEGLSVVDRNVVAPDKGLISYIASNYNTGWMPGDIKLATLSDTDTTNVTGSELHINGNSDFSSTNVSYISNTQSGTATVSGGQLVLSGGTAGYSDHVMTVTGLTVGKRYAITIDQIARSGASGFGFYVDGGYLADSTTGGTYIARNNGTYSFYFTADSTTEGIDLVVSLSTSDTITFDNWSVRLAEEDRSVNNKGLQVFGTVTKTAVATGADLVAYSGFSVSNYLEQPYNSDLQFGTGDFCFSYWVKFSSIAGESIYSTVGTGTSSGTEGVAANTAGDGSIGFAVYTNGIQSGGRTNCGFTTTPTVGVWYCVQNIRRNGVLEFWIDGKRTDTAANTDDINATDSFTRLGGWSNGGYGDSTSLSLFRVGKTSPTAEQIAKMYNDEKFLFQDNAQATLYGTSDAVTALAYDEKTELLHAGTSQGRSVFQGLRRVDNTTDAVATTISARNQMIAEQ